MSDEDIPMAQCGACDSIIPLDSESCPECSVRFGGMAEEELGECGACQVNHTSRQHIMSKLWRSVCRTRTVAEETAVETDHIAGSIEEVPAADEIQETSVTVDDAEEPEDSWKLLMK